MDFAPLYTLLENLVPGDVVGLGCKVYVENKPVF